MLFTCAHRLGASRPPLRSRPAWRSTRCGNRQGVLRPARKAPYASRAALQTLMSASPQAAASWLARACLEPAIAHRNSICRLAGWLAAPLAGWCYFYQLHHHHRQSLIGGVGSIYNAQQASEMLPAASEQQIRIGPAGGGGGGSEGGTEAAREARGRLARHLRTEFRFQQ